MIVLDAYAVVALLTGKPAAREVHALLQAPEPAVLTVLGVAEVVDHLVRVCGGDEDEVALDLAQLGLADAVPLDERSAAAAGLLRARHHHRTNRAVSLADCAAADAARRLGGRLATTDRHLLDLCREESIEVVALPASDGSRWSPRR